MDKVRIFISYARKDREFLDRLLTHLAPMETEGLIEPWTDLAIEAGDRWDREIGAELERANVILLLVSADFLASKYINTVELKRALDREKRREVVVIPVILRFADWQSAEFHDLQALPDKGKPVTDWRNRDEAYLNIATGLRKTIARLRGNGGATALPGAISATPAEPATVEQDRVLDAAMAARIPLGKPSDLSVMVRKTDSAGLKAILGDDDEFTAAPDDVKSKPFRMEFGRDLSGKLRPARLTVKIESPDFDPPAQSEDIVAPPDRDSEVCTFLLRPLFPGELVIKLKVYAQDGSNAVRLMRIISEASDRVIEGGRVLATIPIATVAGARAPELSARAAAVGALPAEATPFPKSPNPPLPPATQAAAPPPASRSRKWMFSSAGALAATVLIGTAVYLVPGGGVAPPVASVSDAIEYPAPPPLAAGSPASRSPASVETAAPPPPSGGWEAEYQKGFAASKSGNLESATKSFETAARMAPAEPGPFTALATANLKLADRQSATGSRKYLTDAVAGANKAAELQPDSAAARYLQGLALEKSGDFAAAEGPLRQATALSPDDGNYWYALGLALAKQNKATDAAQALEGALRLDASNTDARLLLASVLAAEKAPAANKQIEVLAQDSSLSPKKRVAVERLQKSLVRVQ